MPAQIGVLIPALVLTLGGCQADEPSPSMPFTTSANETGGTTGDGDGDGTFTTGGTPTTGDGDGDDPDPSGDGDGNGDGDGDGDGGGDGDGDNPDPSGDGSLCADVCGTPNCGPCPNAPAKVDTGDYLIHSTEVTTDQYAQFLAVDLDPSFLPGALPNGCAFKDDFTPDNWLANPPVGIPVVGVDWCDAAGYCQWAGGRLCGAIGGGPAELNDVQNPATNEWYRACSGGGVSNFPYGLDYDPTACNTVDAPYGQLTDAGGLPSCEGGYDGVFDMSGNVWEWTNACAQDDCRRRGGSMYSDESTARCGIDSLRERSFRADSQGFRCCFDGE